MGSSLLDCWTEAEMPGHWTPAEIKIKNQAFLLELSLLMNHGLGTLNWSLNQSPCSGELRAGVEITVHVEESYGFPSAKNFDELIQRSSKWWPLLMITTESSWQIVPWGSSVTGVCYCAFMQKLCRKVHKNRPQLLMAGRLILHDNAHLHIVDV